MLTDYKKIKVVPDFHIKPTLEEINQILETNHANHQNDGENLTSRFIISNTIGVAERWLDDTAHTINSYFEFLVPENDELSQIVVKYANDENLGWTIYHNGSWPFNSNYLNGPNVFVFMKHAEMSRKPFISGMNLVGFGASIYDPGSYLEVIFLNLGYRATFLSSAKT
ncbi:MAG: hypothetical protein RLZZ230_165 [Candidatus Parcubacteria bacterium]|jgi:hypothetical protein